MIVAEDVWRALETVKDPEIPVVSVVEMGIIRDVDVTPAGVTVTMTPTFSGCPALDVMRCQIEAAVRRLGAAEITVHTILHPPWSTDRISDAGREKLRRFGIAPPPVRSPALRRGEERAEALDYERGGAAEVLFLDLAECPRCGSTNTSLRNAFGPTLCRMIWYCNECRDAFEQFKPL
jgi:ring-1,2-phenylacetyl-CoA epoxidase subunit PaaD